jgi:hypothetical protein
LAAKADLIPQIQGISAASLDEPGRIRVVANIWTASAQPWDYLDPKLPRIATTPTETELAELVEMVKKSNG